MAAQGLAELKKKARVTKAVLVLVDESGFMLQPVVRRTWAPAGQTPIHYTWDRHDRLSVIAAITVSPKQHRLDVYFRKILTTWSARNGSP